MAVLLGQPFEYYYYCCNRYRRSAGCVFSIQLQECWLPLDRHQLCTYTEISDTDLDAEIVRIKVMMGNA